MIQIIRDTLSEIQMKEPYKFENLTVFPIFYLINHGCQYITLKKAMQRNLIKITEVSKVGYVPLVKVKNLSETPVLIMDGEEIQGAKQNRTINTTVLIGQNTEIDINVSCTEKGRWSYHSHPSQVLGIDDFFYTDYSAPCFLRRSKNRSVSDSLKKNRGYLSDQHKIWDDVDTCIDSLDVTTKTSAYKDVYDARRDDVKRFSGALPLRPGQIGLLVAINGKICGLDMISLHSAFAELYPKLVESYAMDAVIRKGEEKKEISLAHATEFIETISKCSVETYDSLGLGKDCRFRGKKKTGTALFYKRCLIHVSFFAQESQEDNDESPDGTSSL